MYKYTFKLIFNTKTISLFECRCAMKNYFIITLYMALYKVNHNNPSIAFFFNALFTAVTFSVILVFNDYVDDYLHKLELQDNIKPVVKGGLHALLILVFTFLLTYLFRYLWGFGDSMIG